MRRLAAVTVLCALLGLTLGTVLVAPAQAADKQLPVPYSFLPNAVFGGIPDSNAPGTNDFSCKPTAAHPNPVVLVHGTLGNRSTNWQTYGPLLKNNGYCVFALTYGSTLPVPFPGAFPLGTSTTVGTLAGTPAAAGSGTSALVAQAFGFGPGLSLPVATQPFGQGPPAGTFFTQPFSITPTPVTLPTQPLSLTTPPGILGSQTSLFNVTTGVSNLINNPPFSPTMATMVTGPSLVNVGPGFTTLTAQPLVVGPGASTLVGLVVPEVEHTDLAIAAKAMAECCNEAGFQLVLSLTEDDPKKE